MKTSRRNSGFMTGLFITLLARGTASADLPWHVTIIEDGYRPGEWTSLALYPEGHAFYPGCYAISHHDYIDGDLEFAWSDGVEWHRVTVDSVGDVGDMI